MAKAGPPKFLRNQSQWLSKSEETCPPCIEHGNGQCHGKLAGWSLAGSSQPSIQETEPLASGLLLSSLQQSAQCQKMA